MFHGDAVRFDVTPASKRRILHLKDESFPNIMAKLVDMGSCLPWVIVDVISGQLPPCVIVDVISWQLLEIKDSHLDELFRGAALQPALLIYTS